MPALSLIVASPDGGRLYAALETAMAAAALGWRARLFVQGEAVALLRRPMTFAGDPARRAAGQPDLMQMIEEAAAMAVELVACQSGLALAGLTAAHIVPEARMGGLVGFLAAMDDEERLVAY